MAISCKLCDFIVVLDKRTKIEFGVNSMEKFVFFKGSVSEFLKSHFYQCYACDFVNDLKIIGNIFVDGYLRIVVNTATE